MIGRESLLIGTSDRKGGSLTGPPTFFCWGRPIPDGGTHLSAKQSANRLADRVRDLVERFVEREGYELIDVEFITERGRPILRMYIDTIPPGTAERGVTVEDCTHVSRVVGDMLDVEDAVPGEYHLEVSSPGLYRPLTKPVHFDRAVGARIKVKTYEKLNDRRVFTGVLVKHESGRLVVDVDGQPQDLELSQVAKANLEPLLDF